jgi:hypothetical protein
MCETSVLRDTATAYCENYMKVVDEEKASVSWYMVDVKWMRKGCWRYGEFISSRVPVTSVAYWPRTLGIH